MKIKLDENVHGDVAAALAAQHHDVATLHDQGLAGRPDADIAHLTRFFAGTTAITGHLWILEDDRARDWTP